MHWVYLATSEVKGTLQDMLAQMIRNYNSQLLLITIMVLKSKVKIIHNFLRGQGVQIYKKKCAMLQKFFAKWYITIYNIFSDKE